MASDNRRLRFGEFELVAATGELFRHDRHSRPVPVKLQPQPAKVLLYLADRCGRLVTRSELQHHLWGDDHFVDYEQGLNYCIRAIRRALDDDATDPRFLETVPRRGYRFHGPVETLAPDPAVRSSFGDSLLRLVRPASRTRSRVPRPALPALAALLALTVAAHWALSAGLLSAPSPPKIAVLPFANHTGAADAEALASSLTDELISHLAAAHEGRLGVIARTTALAYADQRLTAARIGRELDADYLLTGGVQASPAGARVSVQLIRVRDETNLWAEIYDRPLSLDDRDSWVRSIGDEVARRLALPSA